LFKKIVACCFQSAKNTKLGQGYVADANCLQRCKWKDVSARICHT